MAHRPDLRIDDVIDALDGRQVVATEKIKVDFPGTVNSSGKKESVEFDVSPDGKERVSKMVEKAEAEVAKAFAPLLELREATGK